jgi:predicted transcriptional regulator
MRRVFVSNVSMPTQSDSILHVRAPADLVRRIDDIAQSTDRSRNYVARKLLENSLTAADRVAALNEVAAANLEKYNADHARERGPNPGQVIADASTAGHEALRAHQKIAERSSR